MIKPFFFWCRMQKTRNKININNESFLKLFISLHIYTHHNSKFTFVIYKLYVFIVLMSTVKLRKVSHRPTRTPSLTQAVTLPPSSYIPNFPIFTSSSLNVLFSQMFVVVSMWYLYQAISLFGQVDIGCRWTH